MIGWVLVAYALAALAVGIAVVIVAAPLILAVAKRQEADR